MLRPEIHILVQYFMVLLETVELEGLLDSEYFILLVKRQHFLQLLLLQFIKRVVSVVIV